MNIILFSKDRAAQLELFIRSMKEYFNEYNSHKISVLYTYSTDFFKKGYDKLILKYPELNWFKEKNFKSNLVSLLDINKKYTVFFVDDIIWKNKFSIQDIEFKNFENNQNILTLSLRLHPNLTYCYAASVNMKPLSTNVWNWRGLPGDFGYPMSVDGHLYRTNEIIGLVKGLQYKNPNQFEAILAAYPINKPLISCYNKSIIFNNPCNKVQTNNPNKHGNISAEYLNQEFLNGNIIDLEPYRGLDNESCHKEMPVRFIKEN